MASRAPRTRARTPAPARARTRGPQPAPNKRRQARHAATKPARHQTTHDDLIVSLGPDEGFLNWKSSPFVMWLACVRAGVEFEIPPA